MKKLVEALETRFILPIDKGYKKCLNMFNNGGQYNG